MGQATSSLPRDYPPNAILGKMPPIPGEDTSTWIYLYQIHLRAGEPYCFNDTQVGSFILIGGSCGSFTLELDDPTRQITISDSKSIVFTAGADQRGIRLTIQDNPKVWGWGGSTVIVTAAGDLAQKLPIPIYPTPAPNNNIFLRGKRAFTITGSGSLVFHTGTQTVTINGDPQLLQMQSFGNAVVHGSVLGNLNVFHAAHCKVTVDGSVEGNLIQEGYADIEVKGDVRGNIKQRGTGQIRVFGKHHGVVEVNALGGSVRIYNN